MQSHEKSRPGLEAASQQSGETVQPRIPRLPDAWHQQTEYEGAWQYAEGWAAGYAAGWQAVADEVARATGVKPCNAKAVIKWLCDSIDLNQREMRRSA